MPSVNRGSPPRRMPSCKAGSTAPDRYARQADEIRHSADVCHIQATIAFLRHDFDAAWQAYQRGRRLTGGER